MECKIVIIMDGDGSPGVIDDGVEVRVMTYVDEEMECTIDAEVWAALKNDTPTLYGCTSCELLSESTRPYPGAWSKCPRCESRMAEVKYMIKE